ncbi:hypothetical protein M9H77_34552 [Catharanthus roseus]|uniref:Uncharacterized protein n=1 Tax=Catharanthus roseus TaxID=4058 RepID=A0ACB9ZLH5_CATRO|nr:hypothetical protein M9H77_34552 [Catharanthus roseus]
MRRLAKGSLKGGRRRTQQKETSHIGSTCQLLIERYRSQADLFLVLALDLGRCSVRFLGRDPVGEGDRHEQGRNQNNMIGGVGGKKFLPEFPPRERGRGRDRGRSNLSAAKHASLCSTFPYTNAFPAFIYPFIRNWKIVIGDGNCGYRVVADFVFGDEPQWPEVRRGMLYELEHSTNLYVNLVGSEDRVNELVHRINWLVDGLASYVHWFETPDSLYIVANAFNLCVILIAQLGSTTVLPLYLYSDRPEGTLVIGFLTEERHFIQLQLNDMCPIPPLHVQWIHHRSE